MKTIPLGPFSLSGPISLDSAKAHKPKLPVFGSRLEAALYWYEYGLASIPIVPGSKQTAVKWDPWLPSLSRASIQAHWAEHPDHDVGFIVGNDTVVLDADAPQSVVKLEELEERYGITPILVVNTSKGVHHYFRLTGRTVARSDSHCTAVHPERIDVKTGRSMVVLPPSTGKTIAAMGATHARDLNVASQAFIDAVFAHNGRPAPRAPDARWATFEPPQGDLGLLQAVLERLDADCGYDDWLRVAAGAFNVSGGSEEGLALFDQWSATGDKYKGKRDTAGKWRTFRLDHPKPITMGTLRFMVERTGIAWEEVLDAAEEQFQVIDDAGGEV